MTDGPISKPLIDALHAAVSRDGVTAVAKRVGAHRTLVHRWLRGTPMTLAYADRVAAELGLRVGPAEGHD